MRNEGPVVPRVDEGAGEGVWGSGRPHSDPSQGDCLAPGPEVFGTRLSEAAQRAATEGAGVRDDGMGEWAESLANETGLVNEVGMEAVVRQGGPALGGRAPGSKASDAPFSTGAQRRSGGPDRARRTLTDATKVGWAELVGATPSPPRETIA